MIRFKFELVPEEGVVKPYIEPYGYIFRAILMNWLKQIKPELVHELHSYNRIRPYSIQLSYRRKKLIFYLNIFDSNISSVLINDLIKDKNKEFLVSSQTFLLKKVVFEDISISTILKKARPVKSFIMNFIEPTYFKTTRSKNVVRLPIPELIFSNLLNLWNEYYSSEINIEEFPFLQWVNREIYPSSLKIKTISKEMGETIPAAGIVGWTNFEITKNESNYAKLIDAFCRLGELSNIGANRTAGFGVIKYRSKEFF
ncbi:MAG: CRISPR system precrRNA processing endoribonuclease RAMP protein Cas6 [Candidatus Lokiarchaeota archaeon]|nr:CRISPR system precrRNA processing endoribonuclease RAMP protein Cas6 [Candidatus Lokiarchaeota archaeon]